VPAKPWYLSKIIWGAIVAILISAWNAGVSSVFGLPPIPEWVYALLGAFGVYARVTTNTAIK
jgi:hypothetical protein